MKKVLLIIFLLTYWTGSYAQNIWHSQDYEEVQKKYDEVKRVNKSKGNKAWSKKLLEAFPIASDKTIKYQCIINSDSTFSVDVLSHVISAWCKIKYPDAVLDTISTHEHIRFSGILNGVGSTSGTYINAREEVMIDIKDNRV